MAQIDDDTRPVPPGWWQLNQLIRRTRRMLCRFGSVDGDNSFQRSAHFADVASLCKRSWGNIEPDLVPEHSLAMLRELHVDGELLTIPLESAVGVRIHVACSRSGVVAEHAAEAVCALVLPMNG